MALPTLWQAGMSLGGSGPTKPGGRPGGHLHLGAQEGGWGHAYIHTHAPMHSQLLTYLFPHSHTHTHNLSLTHMGHADFCTGLHSFRVSVSPLRGHNSHTSPRTRSPQSVAWMFPTHSPHPQTCVLLSLRSSQAPLTAQSGTNSPPHAGLPGRAASPKTMTAACA